MQHGQRIDFPAGTVLRNGPHHADHSPGTGPDARGRQPPVQDGYPAPGHISADIGRNRGYVLCKPGVEGPLSVIAYGAVVFDGEPAYDAIDGQWLTDEPYVLVHRIAVADGERGRGVAAEFLHRVETLAQERGVKAFRIDTNFDNQTMLRLLERTGFTYCGKVVYRSGERLAYEKRI